jgi:serine/threonine protein kinase
LDESKSEIDMSEQNSDTSREEDIGFTWERSNDATAEASFAGVKRSANEPIKEVVDEEEGESESDAELSSVDDEDEDASDDSHPSESDTGTVSKAEKNLKLIDPEKDESAVKPDNAAEGRYILYIQMQLCSAQTLDDFLRNREKRVGSISPSLSVTNEYAVDIPLALRLFKQISNGVKYVHKQGLIHRDLKPQNCFIDPISGNVKVGDFGLSRENSNAAGAITDDSSVQDVEDDADEPINMMDAENTAGVGTRAYASPEQMRGSKYDASTDIYSLGIMLFELCYPMYTAMERCERFGDIRKQKFPAYWISSVKKSFPKMHELLVCMLSESASERPSANEVFDEVDSLLGEYSVQSLDKAWGKKEGVILLRVEADDHPDVLSRCNAIIKDAAPSATILQYGLRGQASKAIIEFALEAPKDEDVAEKIKSALGENMSVRQIFAT